MEPQAPPCTVTTTGGKLSLKRLAVNGEKPRMLSDVTVSVNVTISIVPRAKGDEEGDPFKPSRKTQTSPTIGGRPDTGVAEESEGFVGMRDSDLGTPVITKGVAYAKQLARRVVEKNVRAKQASTIAPGAAEGSARDETMTSDADNEEVMISRAELNGLTQALTGAVHMLSVLVNKFKLDKDKGEGIREVGNLVKGILSSLEQCGEHRVRRRKRRNEHGGGASYRITSVNKKGYQKRKETSPAEMRIVEDRKRPWKGEVSYAEASGRELRKARIEEAFSDDSEGWRKVERRKRERKAPLVQGDTRVPPDDVRCIWQYMWNTARIELSRYHL